MPVIRYDVSSLRTAHKTKEGFLKTDATVTRTGIFIYRNDDGSIRRELRDHREVFNSDSLESLKMIPLTNDHPQTESRLLTPANAKQFQVGFTGENARADGENVRIPVTVTDADAIAAVDGGKRGLSLGYQCDMVDEGGEYEGMRFDCKQVNIRYNHLAIVNNPRAGENARLDSAEIDNIDSVVPLTITEEKKMPKVKIDGIEYESAQEVINRLDKETARADAAEKAVTDAKASADTATANADSQKSRADAAEGKLAEVPALIVAGVKSRIDLERKAATVLDEKGLEGIATKTDEEIKKAIVLAVFTDAKLDGVSAEYLNARVDSAIEMKDKLTRTDAMASQRQASATHADAKDAEPNVSKSEAKYAKSVTDAWKNDGEGCDGSKSIKDKTFGSMTKK